MSTSIAVQQRGARRCSAVAVPVIGWLLLLAAACGGSSASSSQPSPTGTTASSPSQSPSTSRSFQFSTPDGQVSVSLDGQLPPNWPSDFPTPQESTVAGSGSLGGSDSTRHVAVYTTPTPAPDVLSYYKSASELTTSGAKSAGAGSTYVGSTKIVTPYTGSVTVASRGETTYIVVVLKLPGASPGS